jgi:hypothetical protein
MFDFIVKVIAAAFCIWLIYWLMIFSGIYVFFAYTNDILAIALYAVITVGTFLAGWIVEHPILTLAGVTFLLVNAG